MNDQPAPARSRFTPAMMIVLVILAVVLGILLGNGLASLHGRKGITQCQQNLRSIALCCAMYADLNHAYCPDAGPGKSLADHFNLLTNVVSSATIFHCPSDRRRTRKAVFAVGDGITTGNLSYGYVIGIKWQDHPDSILAFDRLPAGTYAGNRWSRRSPHGTIGGNQLFLDGHVEFKPTLIQTLKGEAVYTNP